MSETTSIDLTIGVIGLGFVGGAVFNYFSELPKVHVLGYDKFKDNGNGIGDFNQTTSNADWLFLCLPTPYIPDQQGYDLTALHEVCQQLHDINFQKPIILKSTVTPTTSEKLATQYNLKIIHNPEFLTARTANEDFRNQTHLVLGKTPKVDQTTFSTLATQYQSYFPTVTHTSLLTSTESEAMKIFVNSFYAIKVQTFTEFHQLTTNHLPNADFNNIRQAMLQNGWINPQHTSIPGPDGQISYGGLCFPKDTSALLDFTKSLTTPYAILEACVKERNQMRQD